MVPHSTAVSGKSLSGRLIQKARIAKGWTLERLAEELQISKVSVWAWEQGKARPRVSRLQEVAQLLDLPLDSLMDPQASHDRLDREASNLLSDCQLRIAAKFGVAPSDVEIKVSFRGRDPDN